MARELDDNELRRRYHAARRALQHGTAALLARMLADYYADESTPIPCGRDRAMLVSQWDAASDRRRCDLCKLLDGKTCPPGGLFPYISQRVPPAHPFCRCTVVAWRNDWRD